MTLPTTNGSYVGAKFNGYVWDGEKWTCADGEDALRSVTTDGTLEGNGTPLSPLSVVGLATAREISLQAAPAAADGSMTVFSSITPAEFDGTANAIITNIAITLDDGTF